jgi:hypothetical protein
MSKQVNLYAYFGKSTKENDKVENSKAIEEQNNELMEVEETQVNIEHEVNIIPYEVGARNIW